MPARAARAAAPSDSAARANGGICDANSAGGMPCSWELAAAAYKGIQVCRVSGIL